MYYIGIDLGGTNIAGGIVSEDGKIVADKSIPTGKDRPIEEIMDDMAQLALSLAEESGIGMENIKSVGIGCPGTVDNKNGIISYSNNIPMKNVPMREYMQNKLKKTINLENDANAAAFGEYAVNGNGADSFLFITLGTGVGGGAVIDGKIYRGFNGVGIEAGHITIVSGGEQCTCGKKGCWEAYASVTSLIKQTETAMKKNSDSLMHSIASQDGKISGRTAFEAAKQGDRAALKVVEQYEQYISDGIVSMVNLFEPEILLIGGGISKEGEYLLNPIIDYVYNNEFNKYCPKTKIGIASLFNDEGIIVAALAAMDR